MTHSTPPTSPIYKASLEVFEKYRIFENPYFLSLADGSMEKRTFFTSQQQFFYAVEFFSRPMAILLARIPDGQKRLDILRNVLEEHGNLESASFHAATFKRFLDSFGYQETSFPEEGPASLAFNHTLISLCSFDAIETPIACLGVIELAFSKISGIIGQGIIQRDWIKKDNLYHYSLHEALDIDHALEFFNLIESSWDIPEKKKAIKKGLNLGVYIFDRLYRDLTS